MKLSHWRLFKALGYLEPCFPERQIMQTFRTTLVVLPIDIVHMLPFDSMITSFGSSAPSTFYQPRCPLDCTHTI